MSEGRVVTLQGQTRGWRDLTLGPTVYNTGGFFGCKLRELLGLGLATTSQTELHITFLLQYCHLMFLQLQGGGRTRIPNRGVPGPEIQYFDPWENGQKRQLRIQIERPRSHLHARLACHCLESVYRATSSPGSSSTIA
jgi:hypothetical protein